MPWLNNLGVSLQPYISTGNLITWGLIAGAFVALRYWIAGMADRQRADNEGKSIENIEAAVIRRELVEFTEAQSKRYHELANEWTAKFGALETTQRECQKLLTERDRQLVVAYAENRTNIDDMNIMKFIIRLLVGEVERLDKRKGANPVIKQAREMLEQLEHKNGNYNKPKSETRQAAEDTLHAAEHTVDAMNRAGHNGN